MKRKKWDGGKENRDEGKVSKKYLKIWLQRAEKDLRKFVTKVKNLQNQNLKYLSQSNF